MGIEIEHDDGRWLVYLAARTSSGNSSRRLLCEALTEEAAMHFVMGFLAGRLHDASSK